MDLIMYLIMYDFLAAQVIWTIPWKKNPLAISKLCFVLPRKYLTTENFGVWNNQKDRRLLSSKLLDRQTFQKKT